MKSVILKSTTKLMAVMAIAALEVRGEEATRTANTPEQRIVVSVADRKLVLIEGDCALRIYDVALGKASTPTPQGKFAIINRVPNPAWFGLSGTVAPGKNNPLGSRWMGLSAKGYGIHGTNVPSSIGKAASHGCVWMRKQDLEELFEMVTVGTTVELQGEPSELLTRILSAGVSE
ncbi:MAG: ErfK/YbiS/YcfS/YnhG [Bryobacterales bacterium]|jgi:lipoprotein-anchoring transpeptidase ErfK/SrfK|nr:ErfK/YbiS/YcfS/YnhG [Bryobacterales bacterium]